MIFDKVMRVYPKKTTKKTIKNYVFGDIPSMKFLKNLFLGALKHEFSGTAPPNLKSKPILKSSSLRALH